MAMILGRLQLREKLWVKFRRKNPEKVVDLQIHRDWSSKIAKHKGLITKLEDYVNTESTLTFKLLNPLARLRTRLAYADMQERGHASFKARGPPTDTTKDIFKKTPPKPKEENECSNTKETEPEYEVMAATIKRQAPFPSFSETVKVIALSKSQSDDIIHVKCTAVSDTTSIVSLTSPCSAHTSSAENVCKGGPDRVDDDSSAKRDKSKRTFLCSDKDAGEGRLKSSCKLAKHKPSTSDKDLDLAPCRPCKPKSKTALVVKPQCVPKVGLSSEKKKIENKSEVKMTDKSKCTIPTPQRWGQRIKKPKQEYEDGPKIVATGPKGCPVCKPSPREDECEETEKSKTDQLADEICKKLEEPPPKPKPPKTTCLPVCVPCVPKCPEPAKPCAKKCGRTFWETVNDFFSFFKAREGCPSPDEAKRKYLLEQARIAADKVDMDLCPRKRVKMCNISRKPKGKKKC